MGALDEIIAATVSTDPDADPATDVHRQRAEAWRAFVAGMKPQIDASTPEGRRLRRALDKAVVDADHLVRADEAVKADLVAIREAVQAAKGRADG